MKKLIFPIFLFLFSLFANAQIPGFEKVFRWGYGPVTTIEETKDAVFFTCGSLLISGDISIPDTLIEIAKLDLGENVTTSFLKGNRLYLVGNSFFIINISNRYQPALISKTPVTAGSDQDISVLGSVAFLRNGELLSVYDISDENKPKYSTSLPGSVNSFALAGGQLCYVINKTIFIAGLQNPLQPVVSDSIQLKQNAYSFCLAGKDNQLFVGSSDIKNKMLVYSNSEGTRFELTDSLDLKQRGDFIKIKGQILGYFDLFWVGFSIGLFDISDLENPKQILSKSIDFQGDDFCFGGNYIITIDGSYGLSFFSKQPDDLFNWEFRIHEAGFMEQPVLKGDELYIPEYSGYKYFKMNQSDIAELKRSDFFGISDVAGDKVSSLDGQDDYLYAALAGSLGVISKSGKPGYENYYRFTGSFETISKLRVQDTILVVLISKDKWDTDGHSFIHLINIKNPKIPADIGTFITQSVISDFYVDSNRIFLSCPDSGVLKYAYPWSGWISSSSEGSFGKDEKPISLIKQKNIFALNSEKKVSLYRESEENQFVKLSEINPGALVGSSTFIDHFLLIQTTASEWQSSPALPVAVYDIKNPESPVFVGYFDTNVKNTGISTDGNRIVVTHGALGFTIYKYKSVPDGVEETAESVPQTFSLKPNYPNPFNPETRIPFTLPDKGKVTFKTYSVLGQLVKEETLEGNPGLNSWLVNLENQSSGIYLVMATWQNRAETVKILLVK